MNQATSSLENQTSSTGSGQGNQQNLLNTSGIRVSLEVPNTPRFILTFFKEHYPSIKNFIANICKQCGLDETQKYLLMLEDSVIEPTLVPMRCRQVLNINNNFDMARREKNDVDMALNRELEHNQIYPQQSNQTLPTQKNIPHMSFTRELRTSAWEGLISKNVFFLPLQTSEMHVQT
eukprot:403340362